MNEFILAIISAYPDIFYDYEDNLLFNVKTGEHIEINSKLWQVVKEWKTM